MPLGRAPLIMRGCEDRVPACREARVSGNAPNTCPVWACRIGPVPSLRHWPTCARQGLGTAVGGT